MFHSEQERDGEKERDRDREMRERERGSYNQPANHFKTIQINLAISKIIYWIEKCFCYVFSKIEK